MVTIIIIAIAVLYLVAIVVTVRALQSAPMGRETPEGFEEIDESQIEPAETTTASHPPVSDRDADSQMAN